MYNARLIPSWSLAICLLPFILADKSQAQIPLIADRVVSSDLEDESRLEWRIQSAKLALDAGLLEIAENIYRNILVDSIILSPERKASLHINLSKSLVGQGDYSAAQAVLEKFPDELKSSQHALYLALSIYGDGRQNVDMVAFRQAIVSAVKGTLSNSDLPWLTLVQGLYEEMIGDMKRASEFFDLALKRAQSPSLRAHLEAIILRQKILSAPANEDLAAELRAKIDAFEGIASVFTFVKEYAVVLYSLGRIDESISAIDRELDNISLNYPLAEREQLKLLKGLILGATTDDGREVFKEIIRTGQNRGIMSISLQLLASAPGRENDLLDFLKVMISRTKPHPLLGQFYYLRSQIALKDPTTRSMAENDAQILLDRFPGLSGISNVYRLLAYAALEKTPRQYRTAADYLVRLRNQSSAAKNLVEINRLIGDCYFLNRDYANAVDFYSAARSRESVSSSTESDGDLIVRLVSALVRVGSIDEALQLIDEVDFEGHSGISDRWRAEWNVAQALQMSSQLDRALERVRLLLRDVTKSSLPTALELRLLWLECYLSLEASQTDGLALRVARLLARLESMPVQIEEGSDIFNEALRNLFKTEILLLQGSVYLHDSDVNAGMMVLNQLRQEFATSASAQRSYLIEAAYHALVSDFVSAQATLTDLVRLYPRSELAPQALFEAALYCERRGAEYYPEAVIILNDLALSYPDDPLFYNARLKQGNLLRLMNDFAGAQIIYENLINAFPAHDMRYIAELSRADCLLALAGNETEDFADVISVLERLLDLPNLPLDFQAETAYKWAFTLIKRQSLSEAKEVLSLSVPRFLFDKKRSSELSTTGRYWVARSMLTLGGLLEDEGSSVEACRIYRKIVAYNLPGRQTAISRADSLMNIE